MLAMVLCMAMAVVCCVWRPVVDDFIEECSMVALVLQQGGGRSG